MKRQNLIANILIYMLMLLIAIIMFFPIMWIISSSFKTLTSITSYPPKLIPKEPQLSNYIEVLTRRNALIYLRNTLILIVGNTVGTLISSSLVAYPLARMKFKGKRIVFSLILATMMVPSAVTIIPQFILFRYLNWIDTLYPLFVPAFFAYPYNVFLFRQFFLTIPKELDEAAMIDGCSRFKIFYKILVPLAKPIFITIGILSSIYWWNELFTPLIYINSEHLKPLTTALISFKAEGQFVTQWNLVMAMATLMIIPPMILYMLGQRYLVEGIKMSGLKG
ncbi:binding-protein-dependent transport systems inner membrane component [Caldicellulosiruptor hydrothermalis 108]|uniref:Binding-protein-dependent transport systems inner membrane component n=1 Tax=Caldicellulosiruptor hydrothermalis (strain DSM 18901 / VKM B-2411 / 108) TaxID=632292 RepID=E4QCE1_CALH1|nr:carbohydrate ABC transporter permease [Caldicellulosiruptor hydrothermalis]ADQ06237.1 binding-protein-dependent transport systems inner membrane component [Caldicellulosiruptor hydrothermalis 108]